MIQPPNIFVNDNSRKRASHRTDSSELHRRISIERQHGGRRGALFAADINC